MLLFKFGLISVGMIYATLVSGLVVFQRDLLYFPSRQDPDPAAAGLEGVARETLRTADGETLVLWYAPPQPGRPTVLFLHGNAGSITDRADRLAFYQARGLGAAFLSWRGYGGSSGRPSEAGLVLDAEAALAALVARGQPQDRIVVVGESLGTGVAVQLAARHSLGAVILEAPYTAAVDIAAGAYPFVPVRWLMLDQFRSRDHIADLGAPLLILHGERDTVIPFASGEALFRLAGEPKEFVSLGPVGHQALFSPDTWAQGARFVDGLFPP
jgi:hypothetical protein